MRRSLLKQCSPRCVLETHGGYGEVWKRVYSGFEQGVVIEKNPEKTRVLAQQRPSWAVFEGTALAVVSSGALALYPIDLIDCDPYGSPWPILAPAIAAVSAPVLAIAVNDGLRQRLAMMQGWTSKDLADEVLKYGNDRLYRDYLAVCREKLTGLLAVCGYELSWWAGRYVGHAHHMTHYAAVAVKRG